MLAAKQLSIPFQSSSDFVKENDVPFTADNVWLTKWYNIQCVNGKIIALRDTFKYVWPVFWRLLFFFFEPREKVTRNDTSIQSIIHQKSACATAEITSNGYSPLEKRVFNLDKISVCRALKVNKLKGK